MDRFINLTSVGGDRFFVNIRAIVRIWPLSGGNSQIKTVDGTYEHVKESIEQIFDKIRNTG